MNLFKWQLQKQEKAVSTLVLEGIRMGFGKQTFLSQK
jgi:hypothetical protein